MSGAATRPDGRPAWVSSILVGVPLAAILAAAALVDEVGVPVFWPTYVLAVLALPVIYIRLARSPAAIVGLLIAWFAVNAFVVALLAPYVEPRSAAWLQNFKEFMYLALLATLVTPLVVGNVGARWRALRSRLIAPDWLAVGVVVVVVLYLIVARFISADWAGSVVYARRFASLPVIYLIGRLLPADKGEFRRAVGYLVWVAFVVAVLGLIERVLLGDRFWTDVVHVGIYRNAIGTEGFGSPHERLPGGIPANWTSSLGGVELRRMVSTFLEPTTLGMFLALSFVLGCAANLRAGLALRSPRWLIVGVIGLALILTLGKGGAVVVLIALFVMAVSGRRRASPSLLLVLAAGVVVILTFASQALPVATNVNRHLGGLLTGLGQLWTQPLGTGLGSTGYWGAIRYVGNDSTIGAIAAQVGLVGAALYVGWLSLTFARLLTSSDGTGPRGYAAAMGGAVLGLLAVAFLSNSASGLVGSAFYLLFGGWLLAIRRADEGSTS